MIGLWSRCGDLISKFVFEVQTIGSGVDWEVFKTNTTFRTQFRFFLTLPNKDFIIKYLETPEVKFMTTLNFSHCYLFGFSLASVTHEAWRHRPPRTRYLTIKACKYSYVVK